MDPDEKNPAPPGAADKTPEEALKSILARIRRTREFPSISKYLMEINQKLSNASAYTTASELANIIMKDYALTNRLLKLVNSAFYGLVSGKVTTVTRAVILLGYENVRLAAISLALFEHFQSKSAIADLKEAVTNSFWCGLVAREIARLDDRADPEEAFICAMLHQLGKLLVIYHLPKEYTAIKSQIQAADGDANKAAKAVLGISYTALSMAVAKAWGFPERIQTSMARLPAERLSDSRKTVDPVLVLTNFSNVLAYQLETSEVANFQAVLTRLRNLYQRVLKVSEAQLLEITLASVDILRTHAAALQIGPGKSALLQRLENFRDRQGKADMAASGSPGKGGTPDTARPFRLLDSTGTGSVAPAAKSDDPIAIILDGLQEITTAMSADPDVNNVILISLEIVYRALKFNRVVMFVNNSATQVMEARFGYGRDIQRIARRTQFKIQPTAEDIFNMAIASAQDLIVEDSQDPELKHLIPQWYRQQFHAPAFMFLPIVFKQICLGAFYADRQQNGPVISELEHRHISMLRNQLILAIRFQKSS